MIVHHAVAHPHGHHHAAPHRHHHHGKAVCHKKHKKRHKHRRYHGHRRMFHIAQIKGPVVYEMMTAPLAATTWMEARNQSPDAQRAVMHVIMNRVALDKDRFGHGILGVVGKRKQYSCLNVYKDGHLEPNRIAFFEMLDKPESNIEKKIWRRLQRMSLEVGSGRDRDNTGGATFYATQSSNPYWRYDMTVIGQVGDHVFFRPKTAHEAKEYARDMAANARLAKARRTARRANKRQVTMTITFKAKVQSHHLHG
jgi:spore germination cell wall hydrolase CwlJ-like protein